MRSRATGDAAAGAETAPAVAVADVRVAVVGVRVAVAVGLAAVAAVLAAVAAVLAAVAVDLAAVAAAVEAERHRGWRPGPGRPRVGGVGIGVARCGLTPVIAVVARVREPALRWRVGAVSQSCRKPKGRSVPAHRDGRDAISAVSRR